MRTSPFPLRQKALSFPLTRTVTNSPAFTEISVLLDELKELITYLLNDLKIQILMLSNYPFLYFLLEQNGTLEFQLLFSLEQTVHLLT